MSNDSIYKNKIRVLHPYEYKQLYNAIDKQDFKDKLDTMLLTGMRYAELRYLYKHKSNLKENKIYVKSNKGKAEHAERYVRLNPMGVGAINHFLNSKKNLPNRVTMNENLKRWCLKAKLDNKGISTKTFRKTWESWLAVMYPNSFQHIFLSQGHTDYVSIQYYLMCPFNDKDKVDMKQYTDGWL